VRANVVAAHNPMQEKKSLVPNGCGLGLRHELLLDLITTDQPIVDFVEAAPENWIGIGGRWAKNFAACVERYPVIFHGLSLSLGGIQPLDIKFIQQLKQFFALHPQCFYSEHLSYCNDEQGQLYELLPMPFTHEAVIYLAQRIKQLQDILERKIAIENISYYAKLDGELTEAEFINAVIAEADCLLLLDVNNVYVNSVNHNYDASEFIRQMPHSSIAYLHIAGHWQKNSNLLIDTHGETIQAPVWELLQQTYAACGQLPTLLERDNAISNLKNLEPEIMQIKSLQAKYAV